MPDVIHEDEEADEELERQLRRDRKGFRAGVAIGSGAAPLPGSVGVARTPEAIVKRINAAGDGASATTEADAGLASVKAESWSLAQENFDEFMGELYIGDIDAARKVWYGTSRAVLCVGWAHALQRVVWLVGHVGAPLRSGLSRAGSRPS